MLPPTILILDFIPIVQTIIDPDTGIFYYFFKEEYRKVCCKGAGMTCGGEGRRFENNEGDKRR